MQLVPGGGDEREGSWQSTSGVARMNKRGERHEREKIWPLDSVAATMHHISIYYSVI